ncbi:MAG TPA: response regulator [Cyclobacteriaceae bacterium]|nr:response regulator [Cyclobacteriaceae bacterium]
MNHQTLLLADDHQASLKLLKGIFESEGFNVLTANNGQEAYEQLLSHSVDVVITDVLMPNVDGYYLCYKIRTHPQLRLTPIIIYTATFTSHSEEKMARDIGANMFIRKPAPLGILIGSVREVLQQPVMETQMVAVPDAKIEVIHQYSSNLVNKLEQRNIELEDALSSLQRTVARFAQAQQIGHLGHWDYDFKTKRSVWSEEMYTIFGLNEKSTKPSLELLIKSIYREDRKMMKDVINRSLETLKPFSEKHRIKQRDGTLKTILSVGQFEFGESLKPLRLYGISLDITDLTDKEKKLELASQELETFIYKAYHDLRSPIVTVQGLVNVAKLDVTDPIALNYFKSIGSIADKQNSMLLKLMRVMNIRSQLPNIVSFQLNDIFEEVLKTLRAAENIDQVKIIIQNNVTTSIKSDRDIVFDIVYNLMENSVIYGDSGRRRPVVILTADRESANRIIIEVKDNGTGITEEVKDNVFNMFFRGTPVSKGTGLGLYLVRNAVDKLGGSITFATHEGEGTTFTVSLPVS